MYILYDFITFYTPHVNEPSVTVNVPVPVHLNEGPGPGTGTDFTSISHAVSQL